MPEEVPTTLEGPILVLPPGLPAEVRLLDSNRGLGFRTNLLALPLTIRVGSGENLKIDKVSIGKAQGVSNQIVTKTLEPGQMFDRAGV
jgi:hypothetical protein